MLTKGEIAVGQWVTVYSWEPTDRHVPDIFGTVTTIAQKDKSYCGDVLKIESVQLPYVLVRKYCNVIKEANKYVSKLDIRCCTLMELTPDYVAAYTGAEVVKKES